MARPGRPDQTKSARSSRQFSRFCYAKNPDKVFGTHNGPIFEQREREGLDPLDIFPHPDDVIINETTGEVTIEGPLSKEQAGARKAVREQAFQSMRRYFEVKAALAKEPTNRTLRREFKELEKYYEFLKQDSERIERHEALRLSRRALETKPHEPHTAMPGSKH